MRLEVWAGSEATGQERQGELIYKTRSGHKDCTKLQPLVAEIGGREEEVQYEETSPLADSERKYRASWKLRIDFSVESRPQMSYCDIRGREDENGKS
jgi:hypothetical protein